MKDNSWKLAILGSFVDIAHGFAFKGEFFRDTPPGDILLTPGNFAIGGGFKGDKLKYYVGNVPKEFVLAEGDLLVTMTDLSKAADTLGYPAIVPKAPKGYRYLHNQRLGKITILPERPVRQDFLYYLLRTRTYRQEVLASATGTTVKHTSPGRIKAFEFLLPPLPEQKAIAHILGTLDDKIELNRKTNKTLEAMARAIFKSWFVDFDPVRAKMEGRQPPGMDAATSDLFPDSFKDSPLGKIPTGWTVLKLGQEVEITKGRSYKSSELSPSTTALVTLKSFRRGGGYRADGLKSYVGNYKEQQVVKPGELIIACTDVTQAADIIGKPAIVQEDSTYKTLVASLDVSVIRPNSNRLAVSFLYCLLCGNHFQNHIYGHTNGTTVLHLSKDGLQRYEFAYPSIMQLAAQFNKIAAPAFCKIQANEQQSRTLAAIRDALLPKLLSGEIRVKDAEKFLEKQT